MQASLVIRKLPQETVPLTGHCSSYPLLALKKESTALIATQIRIMPAALKVKQILNLIFLLGSFASEISLKSAPILS